MNEKIVKALGSVAATCCDCYVCFLYPANYRQSAWKQGRLYTTACGCDQLHIMGWLWIAEKERDWPIAIANFPGVIFGLYGFPDGVDSFLKRNRSEDPGN